MNRVQRMETYRSEMVISVIPSDFACSYMRPSTSLDTALVHSAPWSQISIQKIH